MKATKRFTYFSGNTHQLIANVAPENASDRTLIWSSSNSEVVSAIKVENQANNIKIYPNPASDKFCFDFSESISEKNIKIYNALGQFLISKKTFDSHCEINVEKFKAEGLLIAHIVFDQNSVYKKILLEK